ncbi:MAG: hypothetical protein GXN99_03320 [Candidatus Nanohaloarchaeota archaeon]|nr:hypothetical protein [Candidatus Nanohaloarchaeota archaeon]
MKIGIFDKVDTNIIANKLKGHELYFENIPADIEVAIIRGRTPITKQFLSSFPHIKYVLMVGTGLDHIDMQECEKRGIKVFNAPGSNANAVSELFFYHLINALRLASKACYDVKEHNYLKVDRSAYIGWEVKNKTIGFVGVGAIAKLIISKLSTWNCKIIGYDIIEDKKFEKSHPYFRYTSLEEVLKESDIISINAPLTPQTHHLINHNTIQLMKKGVVVINLARGEIVNSADIVDALNSGKISFYAADVLGNEKNLTSDDLALQNHPKTCITPHIGAQTKESLSNATEQVIENFLKFLQQQNP